MKLRSILTTTLFALVLSSCATTEPMMAKGDHKVMSAIASADTARKAAAKAGYEWRDTKKMIAKAKKLAAKGQTEKALALALKAEKQGIAALAQSKSEAARYAANHK